MLVWLGCEPITPLYISTLRIPLGFCDRLSPKILYLTEILTFGIFSPNQTPNEFKVLSVWFLQRWRAVSNVFKTSFLFNWSIYLCINDVFLTNRGSPTFRRSYNCLGSLAKKKRKKKKSFFIILVSHLVGVQAIDSLHCNCTANRSANTSALCHT